MIPKNKRPRPRVKGKLTKRTFICGINLPITARTIFISNIKTRRGARIFRAISKSKPLFLIKISKNPFLKIKVPGGIT